MPELKSCPFCGGEAELEYDALHHFALCRACLSSTDRMNSEGDAISAWNRRSPPAAVPDPVAAIKFALTIDDHYDRIEFLHAFVDGRVNADEEWDDWREYRAKAISAAPAAPTEAGDE